MDNNTEPTNIELIVGIFSKLGRILKGINTFLDSGEDHLQSVVNGLGFLTLGLFGTVGLMVLSAISPRNPTVFNTLLCAGWIVSPFMLYAWWKHSYEKTRQNNTPANANPSEQAGNGAVLGLMFALAHLFTWSFSTLVVVAVCAVGAYSHFAWWYVWTGVIAMSVAIEAWVVIVTAVVAIMEGGITLDLLKKGAKTMLLVLFLSMASLCVVGFSANKAWG